MSRLIRLLRHEFPLYVVLSLCSILPDNTIFFRLRGWLCSSFLGSCGKDFRCGRHVVFSNPANIHLGNHVYIAYGCWILGGDKVLIGNEVMLGPYCIISPSNHTRMGQSFRYGPPKSGPITIGEGSWLGGQVTVLRNVTIGSGTVIAANTVVQENVPDNVAYGSVNTATVLKKLT